MFFRILHSGVYRSAPLMPTVYRDSFARYTSDVVNCKTGMWLKVEYDITFNLYYFNSHGNARKNNSLDWMIAEKQVILLVEW